MIKLTRINEHEIVLNCEIIEYVEEVPHTVIKTIHGSTYVVKESAEEIIRKVIEFKRKVSTADLRER